MIDSSTKVIFLDEAYANLLDIDDWKIICQGGFTSHDVKWKQAKGFHCRASMYITCQQEMDFGKAHNDAMNRRLHKYYFKSLPHVDPEASHWLREHAMDCIVWAQKMAATDSSAALTERVLAGRDDGLESEDIQRILFVSIVEDNLPECSTEGAEISSAREDEDQDTSIVALRTALVQSSPSWLRHRQLSHILENRLQEKERLKEQEEWRYQGRVEQLISRGVSSDHAALLPRNPEEPFPTPIREDLAVIEERKRKEELEKRKTRAKEVFESPWLRNTEKELKECVEVLQSSTDPDTRASMDALREVIQDKLANHHRNLGTLRCQEALNERKRVCRALGLLSKEDEHLVAS